jgi:uncharacterized protein YaeQ
MALPATIFKATLQISDIDRQYYGEHQLTLARHPSETDERMMVRLFAFALHADENLNFTKGLCADDEPDLWQKSRAADLWWQKNADKLQRFANLRVVELAEAESRGLAGLAQRNMRSQCTIQDGEVWLNCDGQTLSLSPLVRKA